jgi:hypothetical protein
MLTIGIRAGLWMARATGLVGSAAMPAERSPEGTWEGRYETSESGGDLAIRVVADGERWAVQVRATSAYAADPQFLAARDPRVSGDTLAFTLDWGTPVRWTGVVRGDTLSGRMEADHWSGTWSTTRRDESGSR